MELLMNTHNNTNTNIATAERHVALTLSGKKATERKMSALGQADAVGIVAISHGNGAVAKEARARKMETEREGVARAIGHGNYHAFATAWAARTGEVVKFGLKDTNGEVVRRAGDDFVAFRSVIDHKIAQLVDKDKFHTSKGSLTSAAADLMYMRSLHVEACEIMAEREAENAAKRAAATPAVEATPA